MGLRGGGGIARGSSNGYGRAGCGSGSARKGSSRGCRRACSSSRMSRARSRSAAPAPLSFEVSS